MLDGSKREPGRVRKDCRVRGRSGGSVGSGGRQGVGRWSNEDPGFVHGMPGGSGGSHQGHQHGLKQFSTPSERDPLENPEMPSDKGRGAERSLQWIPKILRNKTFSALKGPLGCPEDGLDGGPERLCECTPN